MSRILTSDWKMFVREIDVPDSEIDAIVEKYKSEPQEQKYQCLCYWLHDKGNHASFEQLMDAARKSGQVKLVNHIEATLKVVITSSQPGAMTPLPVKDPIKRKRRRSFSQSSEESDLQEYSATRLLHDYMQLKMDLLRQDISDLRCESDPNDIIRLLYGNALDVITKLLAPHLEAVKRAANRYCRLNLHHVMVADDMIASAASIEGLLNQMSVTGKWDNTRFLRKAVAAIPHSAPERGVAEAILSHYNLHLVYYERATLLKRKKSESEGNEQATGKNDKLVPLEITVSTAFSDITCEDCHHLQVHVLSTAYGIPEESITYYGAEERHSTTITFLIPRQYTSAVMQRNSQLDAVWVLLELNVIEVAIPEVLSFKPSVDCFLTLLRESRTFTVDLLAVTEVLPYQMYVLLDSDREPLTRFGQTNSGKTAIPWDVTPSSSMDNSETACHDAESNALPAVPEHGSLYYHSYSRMSEPPSGLPQLNESTLQRIASHLPSDKWKPLGRVLGLPNRDLDNIATNHYIDPVEQRYQMLQLWVSQNEDATWDKLLDALRTEEVGCSHLARKFRISESKQAHPIYSSPEYLARQDSAAAAASSPLDKERDSSQLPAPVIPIRTPPGTPEPTEQPERPLELNPTHFLEYRLLAGWFKENQQLPNLIRNSVLVTLYIFLVIQLFATAKIAHLLHGRSSYPSACNHNGQIFMVTVSLRYITRFVFPLVLTLQFHYVLARLNLVVHRGRRFLEELQKDKNFTVLQKIALILLNIQVDTSQPMAVQKKKILQRAREDFADDLHAMCLSSLCEGFLLTLAVIGLGAVHYPAVIYPNKIGLSLLGYFDVISCLVLTIFCTLMLAFCSLELKLKYTITAMLEAENLVTADFDIDATQPTVKLTDSLKGEAEKTVNRLALNWCAVDIFMHLGTGLYSILLITSATSGLALSCGVRVGPDQLESDAQNQWLWSVIVTLFAHLLATSVFAIHLMRPVGITLKILGVIFIFCTYEERAAYSQYLQILYAIFPACYCFWYHFAIIVYEFLFTYRCKNHKHVHVKKMVYSIGLILLLVVAVLASVYTEYTSLAPDCKEREGTMSGSFLMSSLARSCPSGKGSFQEMCTCSKGQVCACLSYFSHSL